MSARRNVAIRLDVVATFTIVLVAGWVVYGRFAASDRRFQGMRQIRDRMQSLVNQEVIRDEDLLVVTADGTAIRYELLVPQSRERLARPNVTHPGRLPFICEPASLARNGRYVLFADGSIDRVSDEKLRELLVQSNRSPEALERLSIK